MNKLNLAKFAETTQAFVSKRTPEILTGIGIAGMVTTVVLAVKATPKAMALIEDEKHAQKVRKLSAKDTVKTAWKCYIPAAIMGTASTACLIGATSVSARRTAAIAAAYQLSETALSEYQEKVRETIGEKKEKVVREKIVDDHIEKTPASKSEILVTEKGETLCFDPLTDRYFKSDMDQIRKAENNLNASMLHGFGCTVSLNEFYDELGLNHTDLGDDLGWNTENLIKLHISTHLSDDGKPCISVGHYNPPKYGFY